MCAGALGRFNPNLLSYANNQCALTAYVHATCRFDQSGSKQPMYLGQTDPESWDVELEPIIMHHMLTKFHTQITMVHVDNALPWTSIAVSCIVIARKLIIWIIKDWKLKRDWIREKLRSQSRKNYVDGLILLHGYSLGGGIRPACSATNAIK